MVADRVLGDADTFGKSDEKKSTRRKRNNNGKKASVSCTVPNNTNIVLKGNLTCMGNIVIKTGKSHVTLKSNIRKMYRQARKSKQRRLLREDEDGQRQTELAKAQTAATEAKWVEQELGCEVSDEEHIKLDLEGKGL